MYDVKKVVCMSTSEVYGSAQFIPMSEEHPLCAPHPYGASKIAADRMCYAYIETYQMNICIVRPFNAFGERQKDSGYGGAIALFIKRALNGMPPIIYGDGLQTRDYTYVEDLVRALSAIIEYPKPLPFPINIGTGKEVRIVDLANLIIKIVGAELNPVFVESRPGEVSRLLCDSTRAWELLDWTPHYNLEDGLKRLVNWYRNYKSEEWAKLG
jgi:UDP-glucose 4-epimerase